MFDLAPREGRGEVHTETDPNVLYGRFGPEALGETSSGSSAAAYLNANQRGGTATNGKPSLTIDEAAVQLTRDQASWGDYWGESVTVSFAFRSTAPSDMPDDTSGFSRFSATQINATLLALQAWSDVANITFNRVGSGTSGSGAYSNSATILFGNYSSGSDGAAAFAYYPYSYAYSAVDGDVWINSSLSYNANPQQFNYGHMVLLHEIGHAIGISHPADYNAGDDENITYSEHATYFEDSIQYTVMSYFYETYTGASYGSPYPATIMLDDIAAAQRLYGVNMTTRTGDTVYGFNSNAGRSWFTANSSSTPLIFAVWDAGGTDTFDFSGYSSNARIELREGFFSNVGGLTGNIAIAQGAVIENAKGGNGADTLIGNGVANRLQGNAGNDTLTGLGGADVFVFTAGGGADIVTDFVIGTDKLDASAFGSYISIAQSGADAVVNFTGTVSVRLTNITASNLTDASFVGLNTPEP
ncbi:MAG TPA: M10 family metallopeptidase C-terminal domain-containing protein, partial [Caulobacteraceae bacterium]|nr:M10 family metallopeptidase C-terminal domain-containing protein [Caulobacteraceae bacterium]